MGVVWKATDTTLQRDVAIKVLDLGLAKVWAPDSSDANPSFSPTITANMTQAGDILGAIVHRTPDWDALPKDTPPALGPGR